MMYYVGTISCESNFLKHHGVKGQQWGVRRYQNPDGSLTEEGRQHYGYDTGDYTDNKGSLRRESMSGGLARTMHTSYTLRTAAYDRRNIREANAFDKLERAKNDPKTSQRKLDKLQKKYDKRVQQMKAQREANIDYHEYMKEKKTGWQIAKNLLLSNRSVDRYDASRARGASVARALFETAIPIAGEIADKKRYGATVMWDAMH